MTGAVGFDPKVGVYSVFAAQVGVTPDRTALMGRGRQWSYRELHRDAGRVAAQLQAAGVRRGDYVGLLAARGPETLVAMMGCLRLGAAYVPLDPTYDRAQLAFIAEDMSLAAALIADSYDALADDILTDEVPRIGIAQALATEGAAAETVEGTDVACVLFTSGTTGQPKGVQITHQNITSFSLDQPTYFRVPEDVVLHAATIAADGSFMEIFPTLLAGAAIAAVEAEKPALSEIVSTMRDHNVNVVFFYTGIHELLVDRHLDAFASVRLAIAGGDVMSPDPARRLIEAYPEISLVNVYGPTEATCVTTTHVVTEADLTGEPLSIGGPVTHKDVFLVDDDLKPTEAMVGQMAIAGPGVALGYAGRPERTAESFIDDPRPDHSGKAYLTGDLVRKRPDGAFDFVGRSDRQVKFGGRRIELDGVEHALRAQPGVREVAVEVIAPQGTKRMVAVLMPETPPEEDAAFVRAVLDGAAAQVERATLPTLVRVWPELPLTLAGKIDRKSIRTTLSDELPAATPARPSDRGGMRDLVARIWGEMLGTQDLADDTTFFEAGGTSIQLLEAHAALEAELGPIPVTLLFEVPRLGDLAARLTDTVAPKAQTPQTKATGGDIAVVGMAARLPGVASLDAFWTHIRNGDNLVRLFSEDELEDAPAARSDPAYVPARPVLEGVDQFDAKYFDILPREADLMDPQARVFLEIAVEALEDAGLDPARAPGSVGVFAGTSMSTYLLNNLIEDRDGVESLTGAYQLGNFGHILGNLPDSLATRVAHKLDLKGPAISVATACSTSLTAIAQAVAALRSGQADAALAGGVSITFPQRRGYLSLEGGMAAPDGVCRPFDAQAGGTVFGSGAGVVVLKRLEEAQAAGDHIYGVIRGVGLNNDGAEKISYTAPSVTGQAAAIRMAHQDAGIAPETVSYVECHGTATPLGDPIEVKGLTDAFGAGGQAALGSVKGNLGHLDAAAGVTGVIKTLLMLKAQEIPPVANFQAPNPRIDFGAGFHVPTEPTPWTAETRRAGVSSFGVGGTNVHLVLEEAPLAPEAAVPEGPQILPISAKTPEALAEAGAALAQALEAGAPLAETAFTLQEGRSAHPLRTAIAADTAEAAAKALRSLPPGRQAGTPELAFLFPGQGSQYPGMGAGLYQAEPAFRHWIDRGTEILAPLLDVDLSQLLRPSDPADQAAAEALRNTAVTQPALYLVQYATAKLWEARGVRPTAMLGHSVGEFAAAALSGVMSFEAGLRIIAARGRLMQAQPPGTMLSVRAPLEDLLPHLDGIDLAAQNAPKLQVVAGPDEAIDALAQRLDAAGIATTRLHTSHAFHSAMMDPVVEALEAEISEPLAPPQIPFVSSVTGDWITEAEATSTAYWARQARATVAFEAALRTLAADKPVLLEVGAGATLSAFAAQTLGRDGHGGIVQSLPDHTRAQPDPVAMASAFGQLWAAGLPVEWAKSGPRSPRRISLPTYPFQKKRHWVDPPARSHTQTEVPMPVETSPATAPRLDRLTADLLALFADLSGEDLTPEDASAPFLELGFDSLFLGQISQALMRDYSVDLSFRTLLADYPSIAHLAAHLDEVLPEEAAPAPAAPAPAPVPAPMASTEAPADVAALIQAQMQTMQSVFAEQLRALGQTAPAAAAPTPAPKPAPKPEAPKAKEFKFGRAPTLGATELTPAQKSWVDDLARRYSEAFPSSKAHTQTHRAAHADPRTAAGFRPEWKELTFPIVSDRSKGAEIWDIDGNRFIDLVNGFGQTAFGHSPDFVTEAVTQQLNDGYAIGPQSHKAGPLADRLAKILRHERVTFCNTGSEAVMAAMRVARAVTGREKIVVFANDYHGQFDEVLVKAKARGGDGAALPIAPGIPRSGLANMVVLPYGEDASAEWIEAHMAEIAAVIVEPVQSRYPHLRPVDFVRRLREITAKGGAALVMDEIVTGFRVHLRGLQGLWDIEPDLATYGKVVAGGMPCGLLAGTPRFMDALDGGVWDYGDESAPETAPTFFAGTFVRHPLVLAAIEAVLDHLETEGAVLWDEAAQRASETAETLNAVLAARGLPRMVEAFSSWFMIRVSNQDPRATLLFPLMRLKGVHVLDGFCCFLTTTHGAAELETVVTAFTEAVDELQSVGILGGTVAPKGALPLTEGQREIWMTHQLGDRAAASFNEGVLLRLDGPLDRAALDRALTALIARHDGLRMIFARDGASFELLDPFSLDLGEEVLDEAGLSAFLAAEAETPVEITQGPPLRATLIRLGEDRHALAMTAHHIAVDGWSYNVMIGDLAQLYAAEVAGKTADLPPAPSFAAHAAEGRAPSPDTLAFWKGVYDTVPELPDLPLDHTRPQPRSFAGGTVTHRIAPEAMKAVRTAGAKAGCTLFATLFAGLQITMARLSGATDVVIGVPTGGQALLDDSAMVGHMVNFLPIRAPMDPTQPVSTHLSTVSTAVMDAFDHQDTTYGALVRELEIPRALGRLPLTEIQFNLEKMATDLPMGPLTLRTEPCPKAASNFDMFFNVVEGRDGLRIDVDYNADVLTPETVARWLSLYETVLAEIARDAEQSVAALPLFEAGARAEGDYDRSAMVQDLVRRAAEAHGDRVAAEDGAGQLTHRQLDAVSDAFAAHLQSVYDGPRVAVALPRGIGLPYALLAVLKAGKTFVPLDPSQPEGRLKAIVEAADVGAIIAEEPPAYAPDLTFIRPSDVQHAAQPEPVTTDPEAPAYVIFTSGSTGTPKGVEVPHRALVNFLTSMAEAPGFGPEDSLLSVTTVSFDISLLEIFLPLTTGGRVVIATREDVLDGFRLVERINQGDITTVQATPTLWDMLLDAGLKPGPGLKILAGGEPLSPDLAERLMAGGAALWNMYGPTETTIWSALKQLAPGAPVTIGGPIANTELLVLGPGDAALPEGAEGELCIAGDGLALGYLNRPDLTEAAFTENGGKRLYRTGDIAKRTASGEIQVLGRRDGQIKLRGYRIELGEIETRLRALDGVDKAAVSLRTRANGDKRLVGYIVPDGAAPDTAALAAGLNADLPDYMVPQGWMMLDALPQTANGKLDRKALPEPEAPASVEGTLPATPTEEALAKIWGEVLGLEAVSTTATIYELGADSLVIFRIAARMLDQGLELEARDILAHPTIKALGAHADGRGGSDGQPRRPSLRDFRGGARRTGRRAS